MHSVCFGKGESTFDKRLVLINAMMEGIDIPTSGPKSKSDTSDIKNIHIMDRHCF